MTVNIYEATSNDNLSTAERDLYDLIMAYRAENGLPSVPLSASLTTLAGRHAMDTYFNIWEAGMALPSGANLHSWSDAAYFGDHSVPDVMWKAPERLGTEYPGFGFEISAAGYASVETVLEGWKRSPGHNNVVLNQGAWVDADWKAIGIGMYQPEAYDHDLKYGGFIYHVWFGREEDPAGTPIQEDSTGASVKDAPAESPIKEEPAPKPVEEVPEEKVAELVVSDGPDHHKLAAHSILKAETPQDLFGDTVDGVTFGTKIVFKSEGFGAEHVRYDAATGTLFLDVDRDGTFDGSLTLTGGVTGGGFMAVRSGDATTVSYVKAMPTLGEKQALSAADINGVANQDFLTGDGATKFQVTLQAGASASNRNALGVYEIDAEGNIIDTRILFGDTKSQGGGAATVEDVAAGNKLGFFLLQDGATKIADLAASDALSFTDGSGGTGNLLDGSDLHFTVNGQQHGLAVIHSFQGGLNTDGRAHVVSGVGPDGGSMILGFEDLLNGSDQDFQDVLLSITPFDTEF